jgi:PDZ domain-containing secreted protein
MTSGSRTRSHGRIDPGRDRRALAGLIVSPRHPSTSLRPADLTGGKIIAWYGHPRRTRAEWARSDGIPQKHRRCQGRGAQLFLVPKDNLRRGAEERGQRAAMAEVATWTTR